MRRHPDTDIPCRICNGTKRHPTCDCECGACFGTGLSTWPWDQRRRGTMVGVTIRELGEHSTIEAAIKARSPSMDDLQIHSPGRPNGTGIAAISISWKNPHYPH